MNSTKLTLVAVLAFTVAVQGKPVEHVSVPLRSLDLNDQESTFAAAAIAKLDQTDDIPGDGEIEEGFTKTIPVDLNFLFVHLKENVSVSAELQVSAQPAAAEAPAQNGQPLA